MLCSLDLGVAVWRVPTPAERSIPSDALVLLELDAADDLAVRTERISSAPYPTIVVTRSLTDEDARSYLAAGAFGALDLAERRDVLERQLRGSLRGEPAFRRAVLGAWLRSRAEAPSPQATLTPRQREVLALVSRGATDREIGAALGITVATAQKHVAHVLRKLGVANRAAAVGATSARR